MEVVRLTLVDANTESRLIAAIESLTETTQDFTDSAYTTHNHRQQILMLSEQLRRHLSVVLRIGTGLVSRILTPSNHDMSVLSYYLDLLWRSFSHV